jgi:outer membrane protein OmpA-like peptidoglycan-associated protein
MSTTSSYSSTTYSTSTPATGWPSKLILLLAAIFAILWPALDVNFHGHWQCSTLKNVVMAEIAKHTHLKAYMDENYQGRPQPPEALVRCECNELGKLVLTGKVDNANIRREFSDVAALAIGTDRVDNQIEELNEDALRELQALLDTAPTNMKLNYQVTDLGTVYLTGDLPDPALKDRITEMVRKLRGVRNVVNDLGKELKVPGMLRMHNIWFDFNKWQIRSQSQPHIDEAAQVITKYLADNPQGTVRVEGHTDSIATDKYNQWLSEKRAGAVLEALVNRGIPRERLKAVGKGESMMLVSPDDTPEKRAENRRIEFHFE